MPTGEPQRRVLQLDPRDNVLVALTDLCKGEIVTFAGNDYLLLSDVPAKHKFLTQDLPAAGDVMMYGVLVGKTFEPLRRRAGRLRMSRGGEREHFSATTGRTGKSAREIIGLCCRWFFAKTGTSAF